MTEWMKVIILGIVEGITEFLPISSTGHLIVAGALLKFANTLDGTFEIFIQLGAVVAVVAYYWADLWTQVRTVHQDSGVQRLWLAIIVAAIPAAVLGFLLRDWITETLFRPEVVAISLIMGGIVFLIIERRPVKVAQSTSELQQITVKQAVLVGLAQTLALVPGVSRSGASIIGGMLSGLTREVATAFSFYLSIPVLGGATIFSLLTSLDEINSNDWFNLILGAIISGIVAWFAIGWLLRYVARNNFIPFGYYRIVAGIVILLLVAVNII
ncbi:MAG: undecaprenyl-diphosphate phosphatase [Chitinophagaceae bacterium]|nr:undecaprenyl-diphosphate phosphatase [Anaerolineae bacterium]